MREKVVGNTNKFNIQTDDTKSRQMAGAVMNGRLDKFLWAASASILERQTVEIRWWRTRNC